MKLLIVLFLMINSCTLLESSSTDESLKQSYQEWSEICVSKINEYRKTEGLNPLLRWKEKEDCTHSAAKSDSEAKTAHGSFGSCEEFGQNECPSWPSIESTMEGCLKMMWDEKELPTSAPFSERGHYLNMSSTSYTKVACGFHVTSDGKVWAVQNFR